MNDCQKPFVSIVVCTYNRDIFLGPCLDSLEQLSYPKERYEIIVVDDASTDGTKQLLESRNVKIVRHEINRGIPSARNSGLAAATGEIIAYFDDDAVADPHWLEYLVNPFDDPEVTATGGRTLPYKTEYVCERYLDATGYGNPAPLAFGKSKNPIWRFWVYLKSMFSPISIATTPVEVQAVYTLNAAYRIVSLKAIGGFDETLLSDEDSDVSTRLRRTGAHIIFVPDAVIRHRHRESLRKLVYQTYRRAENTLHYYAKEKKSLPIFPMPLLYAILAIVALVINPTVSIFFLIIGPLMLYIWWPMRAITAGRLEYVVYGHIQFVLELASILGLVRGKLRK